jgi:MoaA/NifB/PqqE/SkfB family radical SAM enzyme
MRIRNFPELNYRAIFTKTGKTIRTKYDRSKPFGQQLYPEISDISFGTKCLANCTYCYTSAIKSGENYIDLVSKIKSLYGSMTMNERPFQVACGGGGEPTLHPDFVPAMQAFYDLGIMPNYTTNGMHLSPEVLQATKEICGGVALSFHPHIEKVFWKAIKDFNSVGIKPNIHLIVGEPGSADQVVRFYENHFDEIDYLVLLPYQAVGRGAQIEVEGEWNKLFHLLKTYKKDKLAFGALFYEYLQANEDTLGHLDLDMYEPEVFSGYRLLDDSFETLRKSSYDLRPKAIAILDEAHAKTQQKRDAKDSQKTRETRTGFC